MRIELMVKPVRATKHSLTWTIGKLYTGFIKIPKGSRGLKERPKEFVLRKLIYKHTRGYLVTGEDAGPISYFMCINTRKLHIPSKEELEYGRN